MEKLYRASLWVAAIANAATLLMILLSIVVRIVGFYLPGIDAYAGYFIAASFFMSMAETFHRNEHIRVSILINNIKEPYKKYFDIFAMLAALFIIGYITFFSAKMVYFSYKFHDVSQLPDATPLWIPQLSFVLGMLVFFIAICERLIKTFKGVK